MAARPWKTHLLGLLATSLVATFLLVTLVPYLARTLFSPPLRGYGARFELLYYLIVAMIPVLVWLIPAFVRQLAHTAYNAHRALLGRSGFYIRYPIPSPPHFRTTLVMSLGPFAVDLLAIVEIEHFLGDLTTRTTGAANTRGFYIAPVFLLLAGLLTALIPGAWIINELGLRLANPKTGEITRASAVFDGILGPLGTIALLVSFITTLESANYSYEAAAFALAVWAVRLFPPVLAAVTVYRLIVEPRVLPSLQEWCNQQKILVKQDLPQTLEAIRPTG
jgi:hypothetical protein